MSSEREMTELAAFLQADPHPTIVTDANGTVREVNDRAARMLGIERDALAGRQIAGLALPEDRPELWATLARLQHADEVRGTAIRLSPLYGAGEVTLDVGAARTEQGTVQLLVWAIELGARSQARAVDRGVVGRLMDAIAGGFIDLDADGNVTAINLHAAEALASDPQVVPGRALTDGAPPSLLLTAIGTAAAQARADRRRIAFTVEPGGTRLAGEAIPLNAEVVVLIHEAEAPHSSRELQDVVADLVAASQTMPPPAADEPPTDETIGRIGETLARAAHELRTPASIISGFANTLRRHRRSMDDDEVERILDRIGVSAIRLVSMLTNMLELGTPEGLTRPTLVPIDIAEAVAEAIAASPVGDVRVETEIQPGTVAIGDRSRLEHSLVNLIGNAAKYGRGRIWIQAKRVGDSVVISVADDGPGVQADIVTKIFEPFVRGRAGKGSGLGLAIARRALHSCGGSLELVRNDSRGASFAISLPAAKPVAKAT